jgi:hypothetical protein
MCLRLFETFYVYLFLTDEVRMHHHLASQQGKKTIILLLVALLALALMQELYSYITPFTLCHVLAGPGLPGGPWKCN